MNPFEKDLKKRADLEYELARKEGDKRFGSRCDHEKVKGGKCLNCFRKAI